MIKRLISLAAILIMLALPMSFVIGVIDSLDIQQRQDKMLGVDLRRCGMNENGHALRDGGVLRCYNKRGLRVKEIRE